MDEMNHFKPGDILMLRIVEVRLGDILRTEIVKINGKQFDVS
jgi:hypothetical protein